MVVTAPLVARRRAPARPIIAMARDATWICSWCKRPIEGGATYVRCSVTACNSGRMKLRFCSMACFDAHVPTARHRSADAIEDTAPEGGGG